MALTKESLFSLELVVEKLYVPYVTCRFPAVAFRLLDFPTILISHVEEELAETIKRKIKSDPYYHVPNQFADLQDKHGNFMLKKGKSCLFKITFDTLAMHLENTPLYIMVIDEFSEVPKLLGNSSLAMNEITSSIKQDIKKNGFTVPSVHGDKGLFKIYSLMGKEIGYMILGFRLLSLGPGLIAHLPSTAIAKRASDIEVSSEPKSIIEEVIEVRQQQSLHAAVTPRVSAKQKQTNDRMEHHSSKLNSTREIGSMTDVEKCDALMQTVDTDNQNIHVAVSTLENKKTTETQTERRPQPKQGKVMQNFEVSEGESDEDDGIVINPNIICPPPLFYNSEAKPQIGIENDMKGQFYTESTVDDFTVDDLSGDEILVKDRNQQKRSDIPATRMIQELPKVCDPKTVVLTSVMGASSIQNSNIVGTNPNQPVFPILTALLTELTKIQNPDFVSQALRQVQATSLSAHQAALVREKEKETKSNKVSQRSQYDGNLSDVSDEGGNKANISSKRKGRKMQKAQASKANVVPKQKGWIRQQPEAAVRKTKLVFGLTNTQRLRLAKQNPTWLETAEKEEKTAKALRQKVRRPGEADQELDNGNLSDTYTEVRRLAAAELEKSTMAGPLMTENAGRKSKQKRSKSRETSQTRANQTRTRSNSPSKTSKVRDRSKSPKSKKGLRKTEEVEKSAGVEDLEIYDRYSPDPGKAEKVESVAESMPSSRIEVHIPSARQDDSDAENTFTDTFEEVTPTERKDPQARFPGFNKDDDTLPEPIAADGSASMNSTTVFDDDSPLESTRVSKQFRPDIPKTDSLFKSTDDYDTKQFHSTDEPELQKLISDDEKSDTLPTPQTNRSSIVHSPATQAADKTRLSMKFEVINPKASLQSPLPAMRRSQQLKIDSMNARPSPTGTPRSRSSQGSSKQPTPRPRKQLREKRLEFKKESIHTESVSSYQPSESENILSLISDGSYSDDFNMSNMSSDKDGSSNISIPELPKLIPSTQLGFTIS